MKAEYQNRTGLFSEIDRIELPSVSVRATISAVEALRDAGAVVDETGGHYTVQIGARMPTGIVAAGHNDPPHVVLRMETDPPWRGARDDFWTQAEWTPCPKCGSPMVWYEAGYVPGYRVCTGDEHHHVLIR